MLASAYGWFYSKVEAIILNPPAGSKYALLIGQIDDGTLRESQSN